MSDHSAIHWTDATWNCLIGCTRVSAGCERCYAERLVHRGLAQQHRGLTRMVNGTPHWTGEVRLVESALALPLKWRKPRRIFVNSLSDLFHESVKDEWIAAIFAVMLLAGHHTYQILTKRAERMHRWLTWFQDQPDKAGLLLEALADISPPAVEWPVGRAARGPWPKPHIWLGVSVEDQATADARIPLLLQTPAAVRWVSYEPGIGPVDFCRINGRTSTRAHDSASMDVLRGIAVYPTGDPEYDEQGYPMEPLDWLVVGGESGPGARPFDLAWARQTIAQSRAAGVPVFMKQMGSRAVWSVEEYKYRHGDRIAAVDIIGGRARFYTTDRKGGAMEEWPADLRVREYPA